jgi:hypothetical protein
MTHTPGQQAYDADLIQQPLYHDGTTRPSWQQLSEIARWSWERNPTPRAAIAKAWDLTAYMECRP